MQNLAVKALEALKHKDFGVARESIVAFADANPLEFHHFMIKGLAEIGLEDWIAAHDTFAEALDDYPHQPQLWAHLATAQEHLGKIEEAINSLQHSLKLKADQADACCALSMLYSKLEKFDEAEAMAHRAYEMGADKVLALNALGVSLMGQDKFEAAEKVLTEAQRIEATNPAVIESFANLARRKASQTGTPAA